MSTKANPNVPPYNSFKGGIETVIGQLSFKRGFAKHCKKHFLANIERWKERMEPKEYEMYVKMRMHYFDHTIFVYSDCMMKLEEILVRTGHRSFKLRKCAFPGCGLFPPVDSISKVCGKHKNEKIKQRQDEIEQSLNGGENVDYVHSDSEEND